MMNPKILFEMEKIIRDHIIYDLIIIKDPVGQSVESGSKLGIFQGWEYGENGGYAC